MERVHEKHSIRERLTLELTGRERLYQAFNLADESRAISAPVECVVRRGSTRFTIIHSILKMQFVQN
jgi:hypothetical protein